MGGVADDNGIVGHTIVLKDLVFINTKSSVSDGLEPEMIGTNVHTITKSCQNITCVP